ncbi:MAG: alpha/beta hydrolase [Blautia sp.]|nr:alpha/beta hydrolase [Blautia sp.]MDY3999485.1 alpha/beta hydrolase [Blautia sp.]
MELIKDIVYGTENPGKQILDLYLPDGNASDVLIYFHGGGLESGDKSTDLQDNFSMLADLGKVVVSADYRMYPDAVFPDFIEDAAAAVNWVKSNIRKYRKISRIFVSGSSAGAYLTVMLAFAPKYLSAYGIRTTDITGYIIDSAQMTTHFNVLRERGLNPSRIIIDEAAPLYFIDENTVFPDIFVIVADHDMPCRYEQNQLFLKALETFHCPPEKIKYRLMTGHEHCDYCSSREFAMMLLDYMESVC